MTDLSQTIAPKSDQLNADDLISGPRTIKVTRVSRMNEPDQPIAVGFEGDNGKPYKPGKSMRRLLVHVWGADGNGYVGRRMTLFRDDAVQFGGMAVGGIRISHLSGIDKPVTMALTVTRAKRAPYTVKPLAASAPSNRDRLFAAAREAAGRGESALSEFRAGLQPAADGALSSISDELSTLAAKIPAHDPETGVFEADDAQQGEPATDEEVF